MFKYLKSTTLSAALALILASNANAVYPVFDSGNLNQHMRGYFISKCKFYRVIGLELR